MQWSMRIGTFLETRKLSVEVLKEHVACRLQSAGVGGDVFFVKNIEKICILQCFLHFMRLGTR